MPDRNRRRSRLAHHQNIVRRRYAEIVENVVDRQVVPGDELKVRPHSSSLDGMPPTDSASHVRFAVDEANHLVAGGHQIRGPSRKAVTTAQCLTNGRIENALAPRIDMPATATKCFRNTSLKGVANTLSLIPVRHEIEYDPAQRQDQKAKLAMAGHHRALSDTTEH